MDPLRELMRRQEEFGWVDEPTLRTMSKDLRVPLYRLEELVSFYPTFRRSPPPRVAIQACRDIACVMAGGCQRASDLRRQFAGDADVEIEDVSCVGRCDRAPAITINGQSVDDRDPIDLAAHFAKRGELTSAPVARPPRSWRCDPYSTADDHYATARRYATGSPEASIDVLTNAGLRGMGGAGYPTGRKWDMVRRAEGAPKYVVCNADESEPGTFKDRVILEDLPHLVVEGMVLAALTVGAETGIIFLRHEYAQARVQLESELVRARELGMLGSNAAGSRRDFEIEIFVSPGGYVLGEETALLEVLEGRRGEPRLKPPYPATHGLWGRPTLINNVETFALATCILGRGVDWWRCQGRDGRAGMKFTSVSGDVCRPGVFEIALGTPVREIIDMAGGMRDGHELRAFLPGGASSGFLAADQIDVPFDFDDLKAAGSMLGTGGLIVIGDRHDLRDLALNLVCFFRNESCGKCVPCRLGTEKAVQLIERARDRSTRGLEWSTLAELAATMEQTSICGLGQVALNPVLSLGKNRSVSHPK